MKQYISVIILVIILFIVIVQFFYHNRRMDRLNKKISIEAAKTNFVLRQLDSLYVDFDSVYAQYDTISFYKNGSFMGKTIITE